MDTYEGFMVNKNGGVLEVVLNRPEVRNAITHEMELNWNAILDAAEVDPEVKVVTLRGAGPVFSAGHDMRGYAGRERPATPTVPDRYSAYPSPRPWYFPKPIVAGVHGYAGPAANMLLSGCDFVIAAKGTRFSFENSKTSTSNPEATPFPMLLPMRVLKKLYMLGGWMDADQALEFQYVQRVVDPEQLEEELSRWADYITKLNPEAVQGTKKAIHRIYEVMGFATMVGLTDRAQQIQREESSELSQIAREKGVREAAKFRDAQFDPNIARV
jgi:enoyl-CoA hydratase